MLCAYVGINEWLIWTQFLSALKYSTDPAMFDDLVPNSTPVAADKGPELHTTRPSSFV
jgi:hypothetical protein